MAQNELLIENSLTNRCLFSSCPCLFINTDKEETIEQEAGTSTGKTKKKRVVGAARKKYLKDRRSKPNDDIQPSSSATLVDDTQTSSGIASVHHNPPLDDEASTTEVTPSNPASQVASNHRAVLPKGGYVLYAVPLREDKTPMVEDIYEVERREVSTSVPVIGDFVPSSLVTRPPEADTPLPDLRGLVQGPLARLSQKLGEKSRVPAKIGIKVPPVLLPSLSPFVPPTVKGSSPPPPPASRPVASTYKEHRQSRGRGRSRFQPHSQRGPRTPSPEDKQRECERRRREREARHNKQHREEREEEKRRAAQQRRPSKALGLPKDLKARPVGKENSRKTSRSLPPTPGPIQERRQLPEVPPEALIPEIVYSSDEGDLFIDEGPFVDFDEDLEDLTQEVIDAALNPQ